MAADTAAATSTSTTANPRAWHHAALGGVAVFLVLGVGAYLVTRSPFFAIASLGGFAGAALAAVLADRAPSHWPWYAYVVLPLGTVGVLQVLLLAAT